MAEIELDAVYSSVERRFVLQMQAMEAFLYFIMRNIWLPCFHMFFFDVTDVSSCGHCVFLAFDRLPYGPSLAG